MQLPFVGHASACYLVRSDHFWWMHRLALQDKITSPELLCGFNSAICYGLQAAKLLPQRSPGSLSGKLFQVCSVNNIGICVACQGTYQLSTAFLVDLFQSSLLSSLFAALL